MKNRFIPIALALLLIISVAFNIRQSEGIAGYEDKLLVDIGNEAYNIYHSHVTDKPFSLIETQRKVDILNDRLSLYRGDVEISYLSKIGNAYDLLMRNYSEYGEKPEIDKAHEALWAYLVSFDIDFDPSAEFITAEDRLNNLNSMILEESSAGNTAEDSDDLPWGQPKFDALYLYITGQLTKELAEKYERVSA